MMNIIIYHLFQRFFVLVESRCKENKMKIIYGILALVFFGALASAHAESSRETLLLERTYKLKIQGEKRFVCREPLPPNGHNYPIYTMLSFEQASYDLWLGNVWTNVDHYSLDARGYEPCSTFRKLTKLKNGEELVGLVRQRITETYAKNGFGNCMRFTREEANLTVEGVKLSGVNEFIVGPVPANRCD